METPLLCPQQVDLRVSYKPHPSIPPPSGPSPKIVTLFTKNNQTWIYKAINLTDKKREQLKKVEPTHSKELRTNKVAADISDSQIQGIQQKSCCRWKLKIFLSVTISKFDPVLSREEQDFELTEFWIHRLTQIDNWSTSGLTLDTMTLLTFSSNNLN